jgi:hypothetical protein
MENFEAQTLQGPTNRRVAAVEISSRQRLLVRACIPMSHANDGLGVILLALVFDDVTPVLAEPVVAQEPFTANFVALSDCTQHSVTINQDVPLGHAPRHVCLQPRP